MADVQRADAMRVRDEHYEQALDFESAGEQRRAQQVTAYTQSGVKLQGSPLSRLLQTSGRINEGVNRLRERGDYAYERGLAGADITEDVGSPVLSFFQGGLGGFSAFGGPAALAAGAGSAPGLGIGAQGGGGSGFGSGAPSSTRSLYFEL